MLKKIANIVLISGSALGLLAVYFFEKIEEEHEHDDHEHHHEEVVVLTEDQREAAGIEIQNAQAGNLQKLILSPAKITLNENRVAHIYPNVEGIAKEVSKNLGEAVKAGETIALIESREIAEAKINYLTALKKTQQTFTFLQQEQNLQEKNISSLQEYLNSVNAFEEAELSLELAKQKLHALGITKTEIESLPTSDPSQLRMYAVKSPLEGTILSRHITAGEYLKTDREAYVIGDLNHLWVEVSFYPKDLPYIAKGQAIEIVDANGHQGNAQILYFSPVVDEDTRRAHAIASLENFNGEWHPGTYVTATTAAEKIPVALLIPKEAVQKIDGEDCAFIHTEKGFEIRPIKVGRCDSNNWEVLSGIDPNENYASNNTFLLKADHEKDEAEHMH